MKQDIKGKLVAALRSGDYKQGKIWLMKDGCYCVNGVLCDLYATENNYTAQQRFDFLSNTLLPRNVRIWAFNEEDDITGFGALLTFGKESQRMSYWSDRGVPFITLAELIETQL